MKLCINCYYHRRPEFHSGRGHHCMHPKVAKIDPVAGERKSVPCELVRGSETYCGEAGNWWEAKPAPIPHPPMVLAYWFGGGARPNPIEHYDPEYSKAAALAKKKGSP